MACASFVNACEDSDLAVCLSRPARLLRGHSCVQTGTIIAELGLHKIFRMFVIALHASLATML